VSFEEIFQPGIRHWKEFQDWQEDRTAEAPVPGPGPVQVDLDKGIIIIESTDSPSPLPRETGEDVDQGGDEDRTEQVRQQGVPQSDPAHGRTGQISV